MHTIKKSERRDFKFEVAHAFVGVHNEHFLRHRRRGRSNRSSRVLGSAPLNKEFDTTKSALV